MQATEKHYGEVVAYMLAKAELVKKIVTIYAEEGQDIYPTKIQFKQLCELLPDHHPVEITFHLNGCVEAGLIDAVIKQSLAITERPEFHVVRITGLTFTKGSDFYYQSQNDAWWKKALDRCINEKTGTIVIDQLLKFLTELQPPM